MGKISARGSCEPVSGGHRGPGIRGAMDLVQGQAAHLVGTGRGHQQVERTAGQKVDQQVVAHSAQQKHPCTTDAQVLSHRVGQVASHASCEGHGGPALVPAKQREAKSQHVSLAALTESLQDPRHQLLQR